MEIDPRKCENPKALDKSVDLGAIFNDNCKAAGEGVCGVDRDDRSTYSSEPKLKKRKRNRCPVDGCGKRLTLIDLTCRCEQKFCMKHRQPEKHFCDYDFKSEGRAKLERDNLIVTGVKVEKI